MNLAKTAGMEGLFGFVLTTLFDQKVPQLQIVLKLRLRAKGFVCLVRTARPGRDGGGGGGGGAQMIFGRVVSQYTPITHL